MRHLTRGLIYLTVFTGILFLLLYWVVSSANAAYWYGEYQFTQLGIEWGKWTISQYTPYTGPVSNQEVQISAGGPNKNSVHVDLFLTNYLPTDKNKWQWYLGGVTLELQGLHHLRELKPIKGQFFDNQTVDLSGWSISSVGVVTREIPEPATLLLLGSGLLGMAVWRRKNSKLNGA